MTVITTWAFCPPTLITDDTCFPVIHMTQCVCVCACVCVCVYIGVCVFMHPSHNADAQKPSSLCNLPLTSSDQIFCLFFIVGTVFPTYHLQGKTDSP